MATVNSWTIEQSSAVYNINGWGMPYFYINSAGHVMVRPHGEKTLPHEEIDLMEVVQSASDPKTGGGLPLRLPLIIRFPDILKHRLEALHSAFDSAIKRANYGSSYRGVYPVKCNQNRYVVEEIVNFGSPFNFSLEAGSKPELLLAMSSLTRGEGDKSARFLICNGFKDKEYIELALISRRLGIGTVIVLEQKEEIDIVIEVAKRKNFKDVVIGVRAKLHTKHNGHFGSTSGQKGKFGLTNVEILYVVSKLEECNMLHCLQVLHFHIGSQIPNTSLLTDGVNEAVQIYCDLDSRGANMKVIDIGGGLGIDYDGTQSQRKWSVSYTLDEYALAVVEAVKLVCDEKNVVHPIICSESGRALVSHQSVLVFEVISASKDVANGLELAAFSNYDDFLEDLPDDSVSKKHELKFAAMIGNIESYINYANKLKHRCIKQFNEGILSLKQLVDGLYEFATKKQGNAKLVKNYQVNLSIFTSALDFWAIKQLFPIMPIHRLNQQPTADGILYDLTCDSDGKFDEFIGDRSSLPLHELDEGVRGGYYLGMFLGGAYQETLGGLHNMFGGPSVVHVELDGQSCIQISRSMRGQSCTNVLEAMKYEPKSMINELVQKGLVDDDTAYLSRAFDSTPYLVFPGIENDSNGN